VSRNPKPIKPGESFGGASRVLGDEPPVPPYPLRRGGVAIPDRSREPDIGAACHDTRKVSPPVAATEELRSGVELGSPRGTDVVQKTAQDYGDSVREPAACVPGPSVPDSTGDRHHPAGRRAAHREGQRRPAAACGHEVTRPR
jgi:hypothetical protein